MQCLFSLSRYKEIIGFQFLLTAHIFQILVVAFLLFLKGYILRNLNKYNILQNIHFIFNKYTVHFGNFLWNCWIVCKIRCRMGYMYLNWICFFLIKLRQRTNQLRKFGQNQRIINSVACMQRWTQKILSENQYAGLKGLRPRCLNGVAIKNIVVSI